jgi:hypothetical protein
MRTFLSLLALLAIAATPLAYSQNATPSPAASASPKRRSHKASPSPSAEAAVTNASPAASATPKKRSRKQATAAASPATSPAAPASTPAPAAPSPTAKEGMLGLFHKKSASPTPAPVANQPQAPASKAAATNPGTPGNGQVWVNTESHVYHKAGSRYYGKTKQGKYMSEADAIKEGDHAAKNE